MFLECKAKRIFDVAGVGAEVMCFKCCLVFFKKKNKNIELKMGGTPFGRQDFSVLSLPPPLVPSPVFSSLVRLSLVSRVLSLVSRSSRVLSLVFRSSLALSRSSLASVFWFESMMCVYDVSYMFMLISAFLNECQKKSYLIRGSFYS